MNIKTITTIDGVNEVDFGSNASRFYWFRNLGTTAVHVSGKADIVAGGDGVAELAAGDSVCIETLSGKVYVLGAGKVQIHNTGDKFCPFKPAPAQSGGEAVDAYTKSESDAKYAQKTDIPSSLPANGGNADTVDDYHVSDVIYSSASKPPQYFTDVARINPETKRIERWNTDNIKVALADRATNAENANTVNGHTVNTDVPNIAFSQMLDSGHSAISALNDGTYYCTNWTDYPSNALDAQGTLIVTNYNTSNTYPWSHRTFYSPHSPNIWHGFTANGVWYGWNEISTTPIKKMTFPSVATNVSGGGNLFLSDFGTPITIVCTSRADTQCTPFFVSNQWLVLAKDAVTLDPIPAGSYSFDVWYI